MLCTASRNPPLATVGEQSLPQRCHLQSCHSLPALSPWGGMCVGWMLSILASVPALPAVNEGIKAAITPEQHLLSFRLSGRGPLAFCAAGYLPRRAGWCTDMLSRLEAAQEIWDDLYQLYVFTADAIAGLVLGNAAGRKLKESDSSDLFSWNISSLGYAKDRTKAE